MPGRPAAPSALGFWGHLNRVMEAGIALLDTAGFVHERDRADDRVPPAATGEPHAQPPAASPRTAPPAHPRSTPPSGTPAPVHPRTAPPPQTTQTTPTASPQAQAPGSPAHAPDPTPAHAPDSATALPSDSQAPTPRSAQALPTVRPQTAPPASPRTEPPADPHPAPLPEAPADATHAPDAHPSADGPRPALPDGDGRNLDTLALQGGRRDVATVATWLRPHGYVEWEGALCRAHWQGSASAYPYPGERVRVTRVPDSEPPVFRAGPLS